MMANDRGMPKLIHFKRNAMVKIHSISGLVSQLSQTLFSDTNSLNPNFLKQCTNTKAAFFTSHEMFNSC